MEAVPDLKSLNTDYEASDTIKIGNHMCSNLIIGSIKNP